MLPAIYVIAAALTWVEVVTLDVLKSNNFRAPSFLNCNAEAGFSPKWGLFRERVSFNAQQGWPLDSELVAAASQLLGEFGGLIASYDATGATKAAAFLYGDHDDTSGARDDIMMETTPVSTAFSQICLYGLITSVFVVYRHKLHQKGAGHYLDMIQWLLGHQNQHVHMFDFLESSAWPVRSIDVEANLAMRARDSSPLRFHQYSSSRSPENVKLLRQEPGPLDSHCWRPPEAIRIAAFGVHGPTTLELTSAIQGALESSQDGKLDLKQQFYGHPCRHDAFSRSLCDWTEAMLPASSPNDAITALLSRMVNQAFHAENWNIYQASAELAAAHAADGFMRSASIWLCSGPIALCVLLHTVAPIIPLVMWQCSNTLNGVLVLDDNAQATLLMTIRMIAANPSGVAIVACEDRVAVRLSWQLGLPPCRVHRRLALYVKRFPWHANQGSLSQQVLMLHSAIWSRTPGYQFRSLLEAFAEQNSDKFPLHFAFPDETRHGFHPYDDLVKYRSAVLIPDHISVASFVEMFTMGMPIFLPGNVWLLRLQKSLPWQFMACEGNLSLSYAREGFNHSGLPALCNETRNSTHVLYYWLAVSDFSTWPHAQRFESIPELLSGLLTVDLVALSQAMRDWASESVSEMLPHWRAVLAGVLDKNSHGRNDSNCDAAIQVEPHLSTQDFPTELPHRDFLYAGFACEHAKYDIANWTSFRSLVESNAEEDFKASFQVYTRSGFMLQTISDVNEKQAETWASLFDAFLTTARSAQSALSVAFLPDHCHLGIVSALLIQARYEFEANSGPDAVLRICHLANIMLAPLEVDGKAQLPIGFWPVNDLMTVVTRLLEA